MGHGVPQKPGEGCKRTQAKEDNLRVALPLRKRTEADLHHAPFTRAASQAQGVLRAIVKD
eukprot:CAMPEP_0115443182 /NCGR_PEP_ID=MMETSP0271-20121206/37735_1 /TAXON_ID=71861 /ORGANISM="Scrippsiella trochoidea, Strain CCMP3099" /LENGTH=59 /DNA_ID=CAMNT_0002869047 /DNA_START=118 /DNA_END=293 /DNA_ORIENTATION=-